MKTLCFAVVGLLLFATAPLSAQSPWESSIGAGIALAVGETDNVVDDGYTIRGQVARRFGLFAVTGQTGWTRLLSGDEESGTEDADLWHAGVGGRVHLGPVFGGVNAFYNFGDTSDKGFGLIPEVGVRFWRLELVGDVRFDHWAAIRAGFVF